MPFGESEACKAGPSTCCVRRYMLIHFILVFQCLLSTIVMQKVHSFLNTHVHKGHAVALKYSFSCTIFQLNNLVIDKKLFLLNHQLAFLFGTLGCRVPFLALFVKFLPEAIII